LRWAVENLFRILKSVGRLDELRSGKPAVIRAFIAATLVGWALTQLICAAMRTERPRCEPSQYRVFALLLANLGSLVEAAEVREQEREDAVLGWLAARSLGTHGCADQLSERPADERRGDERADHRGLTGAQLVESADGLQYSEQIFDGPSQ